jgi:hypothetical protein
MHTETTLERAEELAERILPERTPKRRMLVIVNPYATTVSDRLAIFNRSYLLDPPVVRVTAGDRTLTGVTVVVQNSDTFTCFRGVRSVSPSRPGSRPARCRWRCKGAPPRFNCRH